MITFLVVLLVALFVILCIPTRDANPDAPVVSLNELGYRLQASKPDADGLCNFKIIDRDGEEVARTDTPGTLDDAFAMAAKFVMEEE